MSESSRVRLAIALSTTLLAGLGVFLLNSDDEAVRDFAFVDFYDYYFAGAALDASVSPYDVEWAETAARAASAPVIEGSDFIYPPWFAGLVWPLSRLSPWAAAALWYALSVAALLLFIGRSPPLRSSAWRFGLAVAAPPVLFSLFVGQVNLFVLALLGGAWGARDRAPRLAGALLGVAISIKLSPVLVLIPVATARRWRMLSAAGAVMAACIVIGELVVPGGTVTYLLEILPGATRLTPSLAHPVNQGIAGLFLRLSSPNHWTDPWLAEPGAVPIAATAVSAALLAWVSWRTCWRQAKSAQWEWRAWAALTVVMVVTSPRAWEATYALLLFPAALLLAHRRAGGLLALVWLLLGVQRFMDDFGNHPERHELLRSVPFLSSAALAAALVMLLAIMRAHVESVSEE